MRRSFVTRDCFERVSGLLGGKLLGDHYVENSSCRRDCALPGILCTTPHSLSVTPQGSVSLSLDSAAARIGHPLTPMSVAGVHRRAMRRTYGVGANLGYHPVARAALYGAAATGAGYYGAGYGGWGGYGYHPVARAALAATGAGYYGAGYGGWGGHGYGTGYGYPAYGYGYGTGYGYPGYGYGTGIVRRGLYAAAWRRWR